MCIMSIKISKSTTVCRVFSSHLFRRGIWGKLGTNYHQSCRFFRFPRIKSARSLIGHYPRSKTMATARCNRPLFFSIQFSFYLEVFSLSAIMHEYGLLILLQEVPAICCYLISLYYQRAVVGLFSNWLYPVMFS